MNRSSNWLLASATIAIAFLVIANSHGQQQEEAAKASTSVPVEDFGDGIVVLSIDRTSGIEGRRGSTTLRNATLVQMGGRYFVRGIIYSSPESEEAEWYNGVEVGVAWDDVVGYYKFTPEQMERYIARRTEQEEN